MDRDDLVPRVPLVPVVSGPNASVYTIKIAANTFGFEHIFERENLEKQKVILGQIGRKRARHNLIILFSMSIGDAKGFGFSPSTADTLDQFLHSITQEQMDPANNWKRTLLGSWYGCLLAGIGHIHNVLQMVHRNINPRHIFVVGDVIKIGGYSSCCSSSSNDIEPINSVVSPRYTAPEVSNRQSSQQSQDIWSVGVVLLEMETVRLGWKIQDYEDLINWKEPYEHENLGSWIRALAIKAPQSSTGAGRTILPIIAQCLQREPRSRSSADEVRTALESVGQSLVGKCCSHAERSLRRRMSSHDVALPLDAMEPIGGTALGFLSSIADKMLEACPTSDCKRMFSAFIAACASIQTLTLYSVAVDILYCWAPVFCSDEAAYRKFSGAFVTCLRDAVRSHSYDNCLNSSTERPLDMQAIVQLELSSRDIALVGENGNWGSLRT